jgi:hypothetical protein
MRLDLVLAVASSLAGMWFLPLDSVRLEPWIASGDSVPTRLSFDCAWHPRPPATERVLVDLVLNRREPDRHHVPTPEELEAVRSAGGTVRHRFHVPMIRADLDTAAVRHLISGPRAVATFARTVPDSRVFQLEAQIRFDRTVRTSDVRAIERLGGRELWYVPRPHIIAVTVPDSTIPQVRGLSGVRSIEPFTVGCSVSDVGLPFEELPPPPALMSDSLVERYVPPVMPR